MRIAFLCSSLDPGRNGVGDYTRCLAAELARQGHACISLGLSDTDGILEADAPVVRLDARQPWATRLVQARVAVAAFAPDWVSLQFVPYAWQKRGYAFGLSKRLAPLLGKRRRHLMFHELWVGLNRHDSLINRLHGIIQRRAILALHREMKPSAIHTQAPAYVAALAAEGIAAKRLPLFGNLPIAAGNREAERQRLLTEYAPQLNLPAGQVLFGGWFGTVHPQWDGPELIARVSTASRSAGKHLVLLALGRTGAAGTTLIETLQRKLPPDCTLLVAGESAPADASRLLSTLDFALTANPLALAPKSSTVTACLDHGLPVLVSRNNWQPRGDITVPPSDETGLVFSPAGTAIDLPALLAMRRPASASLPTVAQQFAADLAAVASGQ